MNAAEQSLIEFLPIYNRKDIVDYAIVDAEDFELLDEFLWHRHSDGYAVTSMHCHKVVKLLMHRVLLNVPNGLEVDHINHDKLDNRKVNLRFATNCQNQHNRFAKKGKKFKGVYRRRKGITWYAMIHKDKRNNYLGNFKDEMSAVLAYNAAARQMFGEFACLNDVNSMEP